MSRKIQLFEDLKRLDKLDRHNIGSWPSTIKRLCSALAFVLVLLLGWYVVISSEQDELEQLQHREDTLKKEFVEKQAKAVNLDVLQKQLDEMRDLLQQLLRQLPGKTEMPELLTDISQTALSTGIENDLFQPGPETLKEFYAEQPIEIKMLGTYHQFGKFISDVASLPRVVILNLTDISLTLKNPGKNGEPNADGILELQGKVKTYRYLEDEEAAAAKVGHKTGGKL